MRVTLIIRLIAAIGKDDYLNAGRILRQLVDEEEQKGNKAIAEELMNAWNGDPVNYDRFKPPVNPMFAIDPMEQQRWHKEISYNLTRLEVLTEQLF